ncbi:MAG: Putative lipoprotein [Nitrospira sp.]|nr:MAG: Putative lipoprotein [Nitrospira sp.]
MRQGGFLLGALLVLTTAACHSTQLRMPSEPIGANERSTGISEGHSGGFMLMGFIPINQNDRFQSALNTALAKSGGTRLTDVSVSERWFWTPVGNGFVFKVQGTGVAPK